MIYSFDRFIGLKIDWKIDKINSLDRLRIRSIESINKID